MAIKRIVVELDSEFHKRLKVKVSKSGLTMRYILTELLKKWVGKKDEKN